MTSRGRVRERPNRHAWKACEVKASVGSNPTSSAKYILGSKLAPRSLPYSYSEKVSTISRFPNIEARSLEGLNVQLPQAFADDRNVVIVAFQREHQGLVDSWVPWLEEQAIADSSLRFYELPVIGRIWAPVRKFIDGGMAASIRVPEILQRTFTIYGDVGRITEPLQITDRSTIWLLVVDASGTVHYKTTGGFTSHNAKALATVLTSLH